MSKNNFSYKEKRENLELLLEKINSTVSFEQKEALYLEALETLKDLEQYLTTQQDILTTIIDEE